MKRMSELLDLYNEAVTELGDAPGRPRLIDPLPQRVAAPARKSA